MNIQTILFTIAVICFGILVVFFFQKQKRPSRRRPAIAFAYINKTLLQYVLDMTWTLKLP